ncbi:MAG: rRNA maturation RNase YbeY [Flavobacteriales bacterium]|nr:rRNA maturation RNase YbeY [Flavobacteriales bacterium]
MRRWLERVVRAHDGRIGRLCFVLMSDDGLLGYNIKYLDHHELTDVITFQDDGAEGVSGDVLISYDRVRENARHLGLCVQEELRRVMVHGVLHLLGYTDKRPDARRRMREQEDRWLEDYASTL